MIRPCDREWAMEIIGAEWLARTLDLVIERIEFFEAETKLADDAEGWSHLDCTEALVSAVRDSLPPQRRWDTWKAHKGDGCR